MVDYDPFSVQAMEDPTELYRELREKSPVHRLDAYDAWAVSRFEDVWQAIGDRASYTIVEGPVFVREVLLKPFDPAAAAPGDPDRSFSMCDPPRLTALRRAISPSLRPNAIARLEDCVRALANERLDAVVGAGRFDVVCDYAAPITVAVACRLLGLGSERQAELVEQVNRSSRREPGRPGMGEAAIAAHVALHGEIQQRVRARRAERSGASGTDSNTGTPPGEAGPGPPSVVDAMLDAEFDGEPLRDDQIATQVLTLLVGATETLPKIIAGGAFQLNRHPDQRKQLVRDPALIPGAFEELVRHQGVLQSVGRTALRETVVGGRRIAPGQRIFLLLQSANRDEREFERADAFDIHRRPARHLGFGHGLHHCIGIHVARLEGRVLLAELLRRVPHFEIDESGIERPPSDFQIGYTAMPIEFAPA